MKKLYILALVASGFSANAQTTYFDQNFNASTTLSDYFNATPSQNQFDNIASAGGTSTVSINTENRLVLNRTSSFGLVVARSTDFAPTAPATTPTAAGVYQMKFDFIGNWLSGGGAGTIGQIQVGLGTGYSSTVGIPTNADSYLQIRFNTILNVVDSSFTINVLNTSGVIAAGTSTSAVFKGLKTIRYIMNSKPNPIRYYPHTGTTTADSVDVASNTFDLYVDNTLVFNDAPLTAPTKAPTDFKIASSTGNTRALAVFDNFLYEAPNNFRDLPITLPVTLTSFKAKSEGNAIALNWATASERNSSHFDVLRSADGKVFSTIGSVQSAGNSNANIDYSLKDNEPFAGNNYYQLKQVDKDGTVNLSNVIVGVSNVQPISLSAMASLDGLNINTYADKAGIASFYIFNSNGQKIADRKVLLTQGFNNTEMKANLEAGLYIVKMQLNGRFLTSKLIK
jgi:hypothetical protein